MTRLKVALIEPEIPWNTGNIGRTCLAAGAELHLVGRLGFEISERRLKRAGMDYWKSLRVVRHESVDGFLALIKDEPVLAFSAEGEKTLWEASFDPGGWLVFGGESRGLPPSLRELWRGRLCRIPMEPGARSLNLSTAAAVALYEARRVLSARPA
jgi:tRNA (cytidine/uridine-2'-O-)-methyltransferase